LPLGLGIELIDGVPGGVEQAGGLHLVDDRGVTGGSWLWLNAGVGSFLEQDGQANGNGVDAQNAEPLRSCRRRGAAIDVVLDRARDNRS